MTDMPIMRAAFRTTVSGGGKYEMVFRFTTMDDMHAADDEWRGMLTTPARTDDAGQPMDEKAIRHDERKKVIGEGCIHTRKAQQQDGDGDRADIRAWQEVSSQWFDPTICEIVSEYAAWRDGQPSGAVAAMREEAAKVADSWVRADYSEECNILADSIAQEIRALPTGKQSLQVEERAAGVGREPCPSTFGREHDEAFAWITTNCMAIRRDNGDMDYSLGAMVKAYGAGKAANLSPAAHADVREALENAVEEAVTLLTPPGNVWTGAEAGWHSAAYRVLNSAIEAITPPAALDEGEGK